jgi:hypothetical protein
MKFKKYFENNFNDFFDKEDILNRLKKRGKEVNQRKFVEPLTIICYRGFDADLKSIKTIGDKLILSPKKSEQGMLWFTHKFVNTYNHPKEYVKGRGEWLLTYPLKAKKIYDLVTYEDGSTDQKKPQNIDPDSAENSRYYCSWDMCIELPENWFFSYKSQKFIVTNNKIYIDRSMITKNN